MGRLAQTLGVATNAWRIPIANVNVVGIANSAINRKITKTNWKTATLPIALQAAFASTTGEALYHEEDHTLNKYRCTHTTGPNGYLYHVDVIADSEQHAREIATGCVREKSIFKSMVDTNKWNVEERDRGYSGPAKVMDYGKQ